MTLSYERGKIAVLYATFAKYGEIVDPTNLRVTIYYEGVAIISPTIMTNISSGYYYYCFNITDSFNLDSYSAVYTGQIIGVDFKQEETFNVVAYGTLGGIPDTSAYYCTNADVRAELMGVYLDDLDNIDTVISGLILDEQEAIDRTCNNVFRTLSETIWINGSGLATLVLPHNPIISLDNCVLTIAPAISWYTFQKIAYINVRRADGIEVRTASSVEDVEAAELLVDCVNGFLLIPARVLYSLSIVNPYWNYTFVRGMKNIQVTYSYGFSSATRPREIKKLCAKRVSREVLIRKGDLISGGMSSFSADGFSKAYPGLPYAGRLDRLDVEIRALTQRNRRMSIS